MCLICAELMAGRLTFKEAWGNYKEMYIVPKSDDPHRSEVLDQLQAKLSSERNERRKRAKKTDIDRSMIMKD